MDRQVDSFLELHSLKNGKRRHTEGECDRPHGYRSSRDTFLPFGCHCENGTTKESQAQKWKDKQKQVSQRIRKIARANVPKADTDQKFVLV